ncbi:MAG TPA: STAS domain-containing protein [Spirochaetota bacterium]|nr:STAS domain-containing protein [Spirochaetota bacterium]HOS38115.1 STAS domain-containing protein [Spirochaetota bacterium]HPU87092.1 STAS domain-containing protein [Spirochaetota bacterium]
MSACNTTFSVITLGSARNDAIDYRALVFRVGPGAVLDADTAPSVWVLVKTLIEGGARKFVVNMNGLEFIDSYGIGIFVNAAKTVRGRGGDLALAEVPPSIARILEPINVARFIQIFAAEQDALDYLGGL